MVFKDLGLVSQVFDEQVLTSLHGHLAVGHCRYSTTGSSHLGERPADVPQHGDRQRTLAGPQRQPGEHRRTAGRAGQREAGADTGHRRATTDSDLVCGLLAAAAADTGIEQAALDLLPTLRGAFCLVFGDESTLYAARDPQGVHPLVLGRLERGWVVASETAALDIVGASFVREVEPGELLAIDADGLRSSPLRQPGAQGLRVRVRLPGPPGHHDRRPVGARHPGRDRPQAGRGGPGRRPTW